MAVVTNLKMLLLDDDLPAWQIAAKCGMHPNTLSSYATGKRPSIKAKHLRALSKYFRIPQSEIVGTTDVPV